MTISALYILDLKGKIIISRDYRGDISVNYVERFVSKVLEEEESNLKPIFEEDGVTYIYVKHNNLYFLSVTQLNCDAMVVLNFVYKLIEVFTAYFKEVEEESIRDNFVVTYELLDEMIDFGYPQSTEPAVLKEYITQKSNELHKALVRVPAAATGAVSWRPDNIKHTKNEVFLDVIEKVNIMVSSNGTPLRSEIVGQIRINSQLSGMPELRLGLNDRVKFDVGNRGSGDAAPQQSAPGAPPKKAIEMEDVAFHQCVRLSRFESEKIISFIPPDGEFELMSYRLNTAIKPLIWIEAVVDSHAHSRIEYLIKAKAQFKARSTANNVEIVIPVPPDADSPKFRASIGNVKYAPEKDAIIWTIRQFQGGKEFLLRAHFGLPSIESDESNAKAKRPISVKFEIPYFTVSGIQVRYLRIIEKSGYQALPWVRYITQAGEYQIRMN